MIFVFVPQFKYVGRHFIAKFQSDYTVVIIHHNILIQQSPFHTADVGLSQI